MILFPIFLFGSDFPEYQIATISVKGEIQQVYCEDLNGDARPDLLILHTLTGFPEQQIQRFISIFFQQQGTFKADADQTVLADHGEIVFDITDLNHDGTAELLFLKEDGLYAKSIRTSAFTGHAHQLIKTESLFLTHDKTKLKRHPLSLDLNGDSLPELIIPQIHQMDIYTRNDSGYIRIRRLWLNQSLQLSDQHPQTLIIPISTLICQDFNADARPDLIFIQGRQVDVFLNHFDKKASITELLPPSLRYHMHSRHLTLSALDHLSPLSTSLEMEDLNQDGHTDLLLIQASRAQFPSHISQIQIYMNQYGKLPLLPDQILTAENFGGEHIIKDLNGDSLLDIATLNFDIGIVEATKFLITKKVKNYYNIYLMQPDHVYPEKPDSRITFHRKLTLSDLTGSNLHSQSFDGDFNGDRIPDFMVAVEKNRYAIYTGMGCGQYSGKPMHYFSVTASHHFLTRELNQDVYTDLILWYPDQPERSGQIVLVQSR